MGPLKSRGRHATIIWDLEGDPDGNVQHLREHDVTIEEAEEVLLDPQSARAVSRKSGLPTAFGWTSTGRHLAVVYELVDHDPLTFRPVTAYEVPPPASKKKGKRNAYSVRTARRRQSEPVNTNSAKSFRKRGHRWKT